MGRAKKVVLAYSGGVDTSVCIPYLIHEWGVESVVTLAVDLGQGEELKPIQEKALRFGAEQSLVQDAVNDLIVNYAFPAIQANTLYENRYPLSTALARPLIVKLLVDVANAVGADAVAHGCTGKGNDQVRFDLGIAALNPSLKVLAPAREWGMSREQSIAYGEKYGLTFPVKKSSPYSIDLNILGRSAEAGILEDANLEPPEDVYALTRSVKEAPEDPTYVDIEFEKGVPVGLNGQRLDPRSLFERLNALAGENGVGRLDMIENRLVGIKSREIYEAPALLTLILAHRELESMTLTRDVTHYKFSVENTYSQLVYNGLWYSPLRDALDAFIQKTQERVTGVIRMRLHKGQAVCVGRISPYSLYDTTLSTYGEEDQFDHRAAEGFIYVWGLPTRIWSRIHPH
jgi:argininosuccinate synthase